MSTFTEWQQQAIRAEGNVLVSAGAGTGKTGTVVQRALRLIVEERVSIESILMVTFTEAAAAEMRARLRKELEKTRIAERGAQSIDAAAEAECSALPVPSSALEEQLALLDTAHISTLHGFCLQLIREHFHELGIDPQVTVLDETQAQPLIHATLDEIFLRCYERTAPLAEAALALLRDYGGGSEEKIRGLILKLHRYGQTLPNPELWMTRERERLSAETPPDWEALAVEAFQEWRGEWREEIQRYTEAVNVRQCVAALEHCPAEPTFAEAAGAVRAVTEAGAAEWVRGTKGKFHDPIEKFFIEGAFLNSAMSSEDALREDWRRMREPMRALLELTRAFTREFTRAKRALGGVDFADLEQLALECLLDQSGAPTETARLWQERFTHVFVDECQDINAAQDAIIRAISRDAGNDASSLTPALSRRERGNRTQSSDETNTPGLVQTRAAVLPLPAGEGRGEGEQRTLSPTDQPASSGNRFLVGDVKQSIYRFRLADPKIFRRYEEAWKLSEGGQRIPLADNFRSREAILNFVNPLFAALMRDTLGGVRYDADAQLRFGNPAERSALSVAADATRRVELRVLHRGEETGAGAEAEVENSDGEPRAAEAVDLGSVEAEARLIATRLREMERDRHEIWDAEEKRLRRVEWRDMVVLLRSPGPRVEAFAKEFARAGVPLSAARAGFFSALEVLDLINLLRLLDNPLQDIPLAAVLRSPLFGFSPDELAAIRLEAGREGEFFTALNRFHFQAPRAETSAIAISAKEKVRRFRTSFERWRSLARHTSLSQCLEAALAETHYEAQLLADERGRERTANVRRLLELARNYDPFQRQGLYRFLRFVDEQQDAGLDQDVAATDSGNAVRLMSIHRSKGLEFPVVAVGCLASPFNQRDLHQDILLSPTLGLGAKILCPESQRRYPSLPWWLARRREQRELLGEEIRLLYVAMTRARDTLLLTAFASGKQGEAPWDSGRATPLADRELISARSYWDWLRAWLETATRAGDWTSESSGENALLAWQRQSVSELNAAAAVKREILPGAEGEPRTLDVAALHARVSWNYPWPDAPVEAAKTNVSVLRRRLAEEDEEAKPLFRPRRVTLTDLSAADVGSAHHLFLQHVSLGRAGSLLDLRNETERLVNAAQLTRAQANALDFEALLNFWQSPPGREIRAEPPGNVHRELPFTARFTLAQLAELGMARADSAEEFVIVQGVVDLAVVRAESISILDFKTDAFHRDELATKVRQYAPQLRLYASALSRIYGKPVTGLALHFLKIGVTEKI